LEKQRLSKIYNSYSPTCAKGDSYKTCKKNAVMMHAGIKLNHEICKAVGALMIQRYGDVQFPDELINRIDNLAAHVEDLFKAWPEVHTHFITEACVTGGKRRIDLVNLSNDDRIEFENDHAVDKRDEHDDVRTITVYI